ncbi:hypothetical protein V6N13_001745 [Hibiscus sabdariffa]|uniref:Uncharacterized protein n=1 Tax=Hibiscus sabdariffa TaxID=183260 RepID=A0ABR2G961_9ROSI
MVGCVIKCLVNNEEEVETDPNEEEQGSDGFRAALKASRISSKVCLCFGACKSLEKYQYVYSRLLKFKFPKVANDIKTLLLYKLIILYCTSYKLSQLF